MCGIAGYVRKEGIADAATLEPMLDRLLHRGPDDRGVWAAAGVALGHTRLSILDLSALGHQPMSTPDGTGVLTYNGEVYNFPELRRELEDAGVRFLSRTDSEVVLHALHRWGPQQAVPRFDGMFAFAYHDRRDGSTWLARDRLGIKPLYYAATTFGTVFASEIKALLAHPTVRCRPDPVNVVTHIVRERLDGENTPFEGIRSLLPGTLMKCGAVGDAVVYFDPLRDVDPGRILAGETDAFEEQLRRFEESLRRSVHKHLVSDAPLAVMCSGGLDSGLVTAIAREHNPDVVAYVADVEGAPESETARASRVAGHLGVELRVVRVDKDAFFRLWPAAVYANDRPNFFPQNVAAMAVAETVHADGVKALLSGDGADELFGGYSWYVTEYQAWRRRRLRASLTRNNRWFRAAARVLPWLRPIDLDLLATRPFAAHRTAEQNTVADRLTCVLTDRRELLQEALFRRFDVLPRHEDRAFLARSFQDLYIHLSETLDSADRMAMARSVELRVPFLENELMDFGMHLPRRAKYDRGRSKRLVHAMALRHLPEDVVSLPKIGFDVGNDLWRGMEGFLSNGAAAELLRWPRRQQDGVIRRIRRTPRFLFRMLCFEIWARLFLGGATCEQVAEDLLRYRRVARPSTLR
jgi:asparagine synthase (glutamine-hydrolysing)